MKTKTYAAAAALAGTAVLAACGTESGSGSGGAGDGSESRKDKPTVSVEAIPDTRWVPQKVTVDGKDHPLPKGDTFRLKDAQITFKPGTADPDVGGGESGGTVGCNHFGADVDIEGDIVRVSDLVSEAMGCRGAVGEFESKFLGVFDGTLKAAVEDRDGTKTLTLTSVKGENKGDSITLRESEPAPALKGTRWTIDTLSSGTGPEDSDTSLPPAAKAYLTLTGNNTVTGKLGCNTFHAKATVKDGTIRFGRLSTTRMMCAAPVMKAERQLSEILGGKVSYQQEYNTLTLTGASGESLGARAE